MSVPRATRADECAALPLSPQSVRVKGIVAMLDHPSPAVPSLQPSCNRAPRLTMAHTDTRWQSCPFLHACDGILGRSAALPDTNTNALSRR